MRQSIPGIAVALLLLAVTLYAAFRPAYNWDMFPYLALTLENQGQTPHELHRATYQISRTFMPPADYLTVSGNQPVLRDSATAFVSILPYFRSKPGFIFLTRSLFSIGVHPVVATYLPSLIAYWVTGILVFVGFRRMSTPWLAAGATLMVMAVPVFTYTGRMSSPDMLITCCWTAALLVYHDRPTLAWALLLPAITFRLDALILSGTLTLLSWKGGQLPTKQAVILSVISVVVAGLIASTVPSSFWISLAFTSADYEVSWTTSTIVHNYLQSFLAGLSFTVILVIVLTIYLWFVPSPNNRVSTAWFQARYTALAMVLHWVLHPVLEPRFLLPFYIVMAWLTMAWWTSRISQKQVIL